MAQKDCFTNSDDNIIIIIIIHFLIIKPLQKLVCSCWLDSEMWEKCEGTDRVPLFSTADLYVALC
jgi:hypothetical protein